jgi:hypothetical protein
MLEFKPSWVPTEEDVYVNEPPVMKELPGIWVEMIAVPKSCPSSKTVISLTDTGNMLVPVRTAPDSDKRNTLRIQYQS